MLRSVYDLKTGSMSEVPVTQEELDETASGVVVTPEMVIAERERRLAFGFDFDFDDERGIHHIATSPDDMRKWMDEVTPLAQAFINAGQPAGEITITTETGMVVITATEWQVILINAAGYRQPLYAASFTLMEMAQIPNNYTDDSHWS